MLEPLSEGSNTTAKGQCASQRLAVRAHERQPNLDYHVANGLDCHPEMAAAGLEANFERSAVEYRLGAERHTVGGRLKPNSIEARFTVMLQPGDNGSGFMPKPR